MGTPPLSVVITTFNRSDLVGYAIRSALTQTFEDIEVVVSDNSSTDDTPDVVSQFTDRRLKYFRTPHHLVVSDHFEFARAKANGKLILMLADDDVLTAPALERFVEESDTGDADVICCNVAQYRDPGFPGAGRNTVSCGAFSGSSRVVRPAEFIRPFFSFLPTFETHPSAWVFGKALADSIASKGGRFFMTNGVEFFAWPLAAAMSKRMVFVDAPLTVCGRTGKSWGSNLILANPGQKKIDQFIDDADHDRKFAPLTNFTITNLMAEAILRAKDLFPAELDEYRFSEAGYVRRMVTELSQRLTLGVDVTDDLDELVKYLVRSPELLYHVFNPGGSRTSQSSVSPGLLRRTVRTLGRRAPEGLRGRVKEYQQAREHRQRGEIPGFEVSGDDFGFNDSLGCASFITEVMSSRRLPSRALEIA